MKRVTASLIGLLLATSLSAQEPVTQEREHVVRKGETLWALAGHYFNNPFQWPTIYEANTMVVEDPHWIYPTEILIIPGIAGDTEPGPTQVAMRPPERPARTVFYRPPPVTQAQAQATVLSEPALASYPVRPGEYSSAPYLMDPGDLDVRGRFMRAIRDARAGRGAATSAHPEDLVYLSYVGQTRPEVGDRLALVEIDRRVDGARRGARIIHPRGVVRIISLSRDVMEAQIESQYGPVYPDQLVVPIDMFPDFQVDSASDVEGGFDLEGRILEFVDEQPIYGRASLALVDLGRRDGVKEGDIFQAYLPARAVRDREPGDFRSRIETLPPEMVAELRVIRVTDEYATAKVENITLPRLAEGMPLRRIRMIP